jgi:cobalamin biosynthesis Mg chelatase CobN
MAAGLVLAVMPLVEMPAGSESWWTGAFRADAALSLAMTAVGLAAVFAAGRCLEAAGRGSWSDWLGPLVLGIAICAGLAHWVSLHRGVEPTRQTIAVGETVQSFSGELAGESLDVMYRDRVEVTDIQTSPSPLAVVRTFRPGEVGQTRRSKLDAGSSIGVGDYRLTFVGFSREGGGLEAVISSGREDTITASAPVGGSFTLTIDGDPFRVEEIVENYLGSVGPAVRVSRSDIGSVWVFQRAAQMESPPSLDHQLELESVRRAPAAVFLVSKSTPVWPINVVGILFVLGVVGTLFFRIEDSTGRQG